MAVKDVVVTPNDIFNEGVRVLNEKMDKFQTSIESKVDSEISSVKRVMGENSRSLKETLAAQEKVLDDKIREGIISLTDIRRDVINAVNAYDKEHTQRDTEIYQSIAVQNKKIDNLDIKFVDKPEGDYIYFTNKEGKVKTTFIEKHQCKYVPDEKTLTYKNGKISLKNKFNKDDFKVVDDEINVTGVLLNSGKHLSADRINNDLNNATYNISTITTKLEAVIKKLNTVNGYIASNNFKKSSPDQEALTEFAISCIANSTDKDITKDLIPSGTKIKNTYDNHIWVLNRVTINGLTTINWEDFGSDNICIASNDGVHGLVAGSQDKYRGYVDLNGVISINGLEEELISILSSLNQVEVELNTFDIRLKSIENRLSKLEG